MAKFGKKKTKELVQQSLERAGWRFADAVPALKEAIGPDPLDRIAFLLANEETLLLKLVEDAAERRNARLSSRLPPSWLTPAELIDSDIPF